VHNVTHSKTKMMMGLVKGVPLLFKT